jgi:hypothetical protein
MDSDRDQLQEANEYGEGGRAGDGAAADADSRHAATANGGGKTRSSPVPSTTIDWDRSRGLAIDASAAAAATASPVARSSSRSPRPPAAVVSPTKQVFDPINLSQRTTHTGSGDDSPQMYAFPDGNGISETSNPYGSSRYAGPTKNVNAYPSFAASAAGSAADKGHHVLTSTPTTTQATGKIPLTDSTAYWLTWYFAFNLGLTLFNKLVLVNFPFAYVSGVGADHAKTPRAHPAPADAYRSPRLERERRLLRRATAWHVCGLARRVGWLT